MKRVHIKKLTIFIGLAFSVNFGIAMQPSLAKAQATTKLVGDLAIEPLEVTPDWVRTLITAGANVNATSFFYDTPLISAVSAEPEIMKILIEAGADVNQPNASGTTALMKAAIANKPEIVKILLHAGANVNVRDAKELRSALGWAAKYQHREIVRLLLEAGADVNTRRARGWTILMDLATENKVEMMREFLNAGADATLKNADGKTALDIARDNGEQEAIDLLVAATKTHKVK